MECHADPEARRLARRRSALHYGERQTMSRGPPYIRLPGRLLSRPVAASRSSARRSAMRSDNVTAPSARAIGSNIISSPCSDSRSTAARCQRPSPLLMAKWYRIAARNSIIFTRVSPTMPSRAEGQAAMPLGEHTLAHKATADSTPGSLLRPETRRFDPEQPFTTGGEHGRSYVFAGSRFESS